MEGFRQLFGSAKRLVAIGMIHVRALPGTPKHKASLSEIIDKACLEAEIYKQYQLDGVLVENMHDIPYLRGAVGPEIVSGMTRICSEVKRVVGSMPVGVQVLTAANKEAVAVAHSSGAEFVRVEGYIFSHVADEGWIDSCSGELLRYRKLIGGDGILLFTDIKKKHSSHVVTQDINVQEMAEAAQFFLSDGIVLTGSKTGSPTPLKDLYQVKAFVSLPVIIGSGVTSENIGHYREADAVIVGSHFKKDGLWSNDIDASRVELFMTSFKRLVISSE